MKRITVIFDETTIINFSFIWKLMKRYYLIALIAPVIPILAGGIFYLKQNRIYTTSVSFKNVSSESDSPTSAIAKLLGEKTGQIKPEEVVAMGQSPDFLHKLATHLYKHPEFANFNLNMPNAKEIKSNVEMFKGCKGNDDCVIQHLRGFVGNFFSLEQDRMLDTKFYVRVRTLDPFTSTVILSAISDLLEEERTLTIKHFLHEQRKLSEELIEKKKEELKNTDIVALKDQMEMIEGKLLVSNRKYENLLRAYEEKKFQLNRAEITFKQTEQAISQVRDQDERLKLEKIDAIRTRVNEIQNDISALELNRSSFTEQDVLIVNELKKELKRKKKELQELGGTTRSLSSEENFLSSKDKVSSFTEFDFKVLKREYEKISSDLAVATKEREEIAAEKTVLQNKLEELKPSFEYLKLLETKSMQLKLVESTVVSDIIFDKQVSPVQMFRKAAKEKVFLFSISLGILLMLMSLVIRYLSDSRMYDEYELKKNFEDLDIIGNTPDFK